MSETIDNLSRDQWLEIYEILDNDGHLSGIGKVALKILNN